MMMKHLQVMVLIIFEKIKNLVQLYFVFILYFDRFLQCFICNAVDDL